MREDEAGRDVDVWLEGRQFVTATVSWDGDLGRHVRVRQGVCERECVCVCVQILVYFGEREGLSEGEGRRRRGSG